MDDAALVRSGMAVPVLWLLPAGSISGKRQGTPWHEQRLLEKHGVSSLTPSHHATITSRGIA